jgi:hypothetical protein
MKWVKTENSLPEKEGHYLCKYKDDGDYGYTEPNSGFAVGEFIKRFKDFSFITPRHSHMYAVEWMTTRLEDIE